MVKHTELEAQLIKLLRSVAIEIYQSVYKTGRGGAKKRAVRTLDLAP